MKIIFSTVAYQDFAENLYRNYIFNISPDIEIGKIERNQFPDGEIGLRIVTPVQNQDVIFVGGTWNNDDTLEIYDLCCAIAKYGARSLTLIIPYFGCSTMERAVHDRDVVTAKTRARLLSSIPQTHNGNRALLLDLHSEGIPHYFEGNMTATHIYAKTVIEKHIVAEADKLFKISGLKYVIASTDAGRAKWVESLANDLQVPSAFIIKRRIDSVTTEILSVSADVDGKFVFLYDDMIRTGNSLIKAAKAYLSVGAAGISVIATHGVFTVTPQKTIDELTNIKYNMVQLLIPNIAVTNSHPRTNGLENCDILDVVPLFTQYLQD